MDVAEPEPRAEGGEASPPASAAEVDDATSSEAFRVRLRGPHPTAFPSRVASPVSRLGMPPRLGS